MALLYPSVPRDAVSDINNITPIFEDAIALSGSGGSQTSKINIGGPHSLFTVDAFTPDGQGVFDDYIPTLGTYLYVMAYTTGASVTLTISFSIASLTASVSWRQAVQFTLTSGVLFQLNAYSIPAPFARTVLANASGTPANVEYSVDVRLR